MFGRLKDFFALERNVLAGAIATIGWFSAHVIWLQFMPKYLEELGANAMFTGLLFSLYFVAIAAGNILGGRFSDSHGRKNVVVASLILQAFSIAGAMLADDWTMVVPAVMMSGFAFGTGVTANAAIITDSLPKNRKATGIAVAQIFNIVATSIMVPIWGVLAHENGFIDGMRTAMAAIVAVVLSVVTTVYVTMIDKRRDGKSPIIPRVSASAFMKLVSQIPKPIKNFILVRSVSLCAWSLISTYTVLYAINVVGITPVEWGVIGSVAFAIFGVTSFVGAKISDNHGRKIVFIMTFASAVAIPLIYIFSTSFLHILMAGVFAGMLGFGVSSIDAYISDHAPRKIKGRIMGAAGFFLTTSSIAGPFIGGMIFSFSPQILMAVSAAIGAASVFMAWKLIK